MRCGAAEWASWRPAAAAAPAAYVRAVALVVQRLEQIHAPATHEAARQRHGYAAPAIGLGARLVYDASGLVLDQPRDRCRTG
jgi:uncharacterized protein